MLDIPEFGKPSDVRIEADARDPFGEAFTGQRAGYAAVQLPNWRFTITRSGDEFTVADSRQDDDVQGFPRISYVNRDDLHNLAQQILALLED